jgi:hypothetical protein
MTRARVIVVSCGALVIACAPAPPTGLQPTTESVVAQILAPSCGTSGCHSRPEPQQGLDLSSADGIMRTAISRPPTIGTAASRYPSIITPGDPDASFLVAKITLPGADEGVPMPPTEYMLTDDAVRTIRDWITQMPASP